MTSASGKLYVPNAVHTALLQGNRLADHIQSGTVTVPSNEEDLKRMNKERMQKKISILICAKYWRYSEDSVNLRANSLKGHVEYDNEWGYLYETDLPTKLETLLRELSWLCDNSN